jgi:hypothetical protein
MIIEVNTKILGYPGININQLVFLSMVLGKNQPNNQDVRKIVSLISDDEISYLIAQELITSIERGNSITYQPTDKLKQLVAPEKDYFDSFYDMYPVYVVRPDGTKAYLRANINKCRHLFNTYVGKSEAMADHLISCLDKEVSKKMQTGKISYMKTMWRWLVDHQWEEIEEEMQDTAKQSNDYGTELF